MLCSVASPEGAVNHSLGRPPAWGWGLVLAWGWVRCLGSLTGLVSVSVLACYLVLARVSALRMGWASVSG